MRTLLTLASIAIVSSAPATDWPQFRGPNGAGVSDEKNLPVAFTETDGVRWKAKLPARGVSSPVVVGDKVFVTCSSGQRDDKLHVLAFSASTGGQLWHRQFAATGITAGHPKTCMAAPTPVADATAVYALFATADVAALDHDGNLLWYRSLNGDYKTISNVVGMASSPVLYKDKLLVPMDNSGDSFLAAIDVKTGANVWKAPRHKGNNWVTPTVREITSTEAEVLFQNQKEFVAHDADTGKVKWTQKWPGAVPMVTVADGLMLVPTGGLAMVKPAGEKMEEVWKSAKLRTGYSSPLVYDGHVYAANPGSGVVTCVDAKTGKDVWTERVKGNKQTFSASPVAGDGKVYVLSEAGTLTVFKAGGKEAEVLGTSELKEEGLGTPAISGGAVFVRTDKHLWCIGAKAGGKK
jgi:outer membrane protein assembly factor BamB